VTIPAGTYGQAINTFTNLDTDSNYIIKRMGLFSNVADGLILASPACRPRLTLEGIKYTSVAMAGTVTLVGKTLTGIGTDFTLLTPGASRIKIAGLIFTVATVTDALNATVTQYGNLLTVVPFANLSYTSLSAAPIPGGNLYVSVLLNGTLNTMVEAEKFMPVSLYGANTFLYATLVLSSNLDLLTKTVDTTITDTMYLDLMTEIEITGV
jgi:hypothetical protein